MAIDILGRLVAFESVTSVSNREAIAYIADHFDRLGASVRRLPSRGADKENLWVTFGEAAAEGVVLSGHIDVVPVTGQDWTRPPFTLTREAGRLYGRGTTDMKGFIACVMAAASRIDPTTLSRPIHVAITFDEEVGCIGARELVDFMEDETFRPGVIVVGEPTGMAVVDRHKGSVGFTTEVVGRSSHSSQVHLGFNAIELAAELVGFLVKLGIDQKLGAPDPHFPYPFPSINVGTIHGGQVRNIVAPTCAFDWEIRPVLPSQLTAIRHAFDVHVEDRIASLRRDGGFVPTIETRCIYDTPPLVADPQSEAAGLALKLLERNATMAVSYGTEAGIYQEAGHAVAVCGPGDIQQAHTPDEWIAIDQLEDCMIFLRRLIEYCARG
ncbi:acetylornithine deacetylase [Methylocapsa sp. S129]|uniref:acetylornithine deacetylase n=1 Tax=Methylocapsa sp. S129 TaxID=1641869 RepID=UPI00131B9E4A|nr:acetylornithine deacetylase [Methylocapsa sp. S129]